LTLALVLAVVAWVSPCQALGAGSYQVSACNFAPEAASNSWTWASSDPAQPSHYAEHANCPYRLGGGGGNADQEGGLSTTDALGLSSGAAPGTSAGWTFTAPAGTLITGLSYERYIGHQLDPFNDWSPVLRADGTIVPGETCLDSSHNGETCSVGGPPGEGGEPAVITGLSAHKLSLGIVCQAPSGDECVTGATEHQVWAAMYGATVTLSDPTPPTLSAPSGALWGPGEADGFHKGAESVAVSAEDVGGGVESIVLAADGRPVETYAAPCNFTFAQPCPSSTGPQTLTLPTTVLSNGTHTLTLVATDAAGNQSTAASEQITVDNSPPPPPTGLSASVVVPAAGSGAGHSATAMIHVTETLRDRELVVHVTGPTSGRVRVSFTGRLGGRTVASGAKTLALKRGRLTATFKLGPRTAAHAAIRVTARLDHEPAVSSGLRREPSLLADRVLMATNSGDFNWPGPYPLEI